MRLSASGSAPLLIETFKQRRGGTVGFALSGVSLRVQDEPVQPVPIGQIGGIQIKCPNVFKDYWRMPEKTAEEFAQAEFFGTSDVGKIDSQGYVTVVGRSKHLISSGGYDVYLAHVIADLKSKLANFKVSK